VKPDRLDFVIVKMLRPGLNGFRAFLFHEISLTHGVDAPDLARAPCKQGSRERCSSVVAAHIPSLCVTPPDITLEATMPKMTTAELKAMLAAEKADALSAMHASRLSDERTDAMDYYLGDMSRDMPAADGRSRAVSTDVADTVEGMMPALMDIFCSGEEVVEFHPIGEEDVAAAEEETDYVNHVFMQKNSGFLILYSFIKDALLSKVGIVKVWWEEEEREQRETFYGLTDDQFMMIAANPAVEIIAHSVYDIPQPTADEKEASAAVIASQPSREEPQQIPLKDMGEV
jgi:hypothetical protein